VCLWSFLSSVIGKTIRLRFTPLREPERREIAELLGQANHSPELINSFLVELDRAASWFFAHDASQVTAPKPAQVDKQLAQLEANAQKITAELFALRREQPFVLEGISTWHGLNVDALSDQLGRLRSGIHMERQMLNPTRGRPEMSMHENQMILEAMLGYYHRFGRPTATQGNLFENILGRVLAATVGERSEEHVHRLAAIVMGNYFHKKLFGNSLV